MTAQFALTKFWSTWLKSPGTNWIHVGMIICLNEGCECVNNRPIWVLIVSGAICP